MRSNIQSCSHKHKTPKVAIIDNYDSFTYNLAHYIEAIGYSFSVFLNDEITPKEIEILEPFTHIIISPGPGSPKESKISMDVIKHYKEKKKILGVCLGHQCIAQAFGGKISRLKTPMHAKMSRILLKPCELFKDLPQNISVGRYHSLYVSSLPSELLAIAVDSEGILMALKHKNKAIYGVQFHPESALSEGGEIILKNFLNL